MKKFLSLLLCTALVMTLFSACSKETSSSKTAVKTGLAILTAADKSKDAAADADGLAEADSTAVAVLVDSKGVIVKCVIDVVQTKINFNAKGEITTDMATEFVSKKELGDAYGMKSKSGIGKEWYEQAKALEDYVTGKTVDQVKGIALTEGKASGADLTGSVTVSIGDIIEGIVKAVGNAQDLGASSSDKLGLGIISSLGQSKNTADGADGLAQAYTYYGAVTFNKDGKITSSILDASQTNVNFAADGKITSDLAQEFKTKVELGDAYGMKSKSGIGKEWFEQAKAFSDYIKGKAAADVKAIAVNEEGAATAADLTSSVTVGIGEFQVVVDKAGATAK